MKFFSVYIVSFLFLFPATIFAQENWIAKTVKDSSLFDVVKEHDKAVNEGPGARNEKEDGPEEIYQRWEHFTAPRVKPDGTAYPPDILYKEWLKFKKTQAQVSYKTGANAWQYSGPFTSPGNNGGDGRINCIALQPGNPNIIWAGVPSGGLWKSTDGGTHWSTNTDNLPNLGVTDIAINPFHPDTMFIATGDGFGYILGQNYFGGTYSIGVLRSVDGGNTWDTTGMTWSLTSSRQIYRLHINPRSPDTILATTSNGIWLSPNAGDTWKKVAAGTFEDIASNPLNPSELFATSINPTALYKSSNGGKTWAALTTGFTTSGPLAIATTSADTSIVFAILQDPNSNTGYIYKSSNSGLSWTYKASVSSTTFYGWYTLALKVSPRDTNTVYVGGVDLAKSTDGGISFNSITSYNGTLGYNYCHPDHRALVFYPGSADTLYDGNDGGMYRTYDGGTTWTQISGGIHALQIYRIGSSFSKPNLFYVGAQDNGINQGDSSTWNFMRQGDGMECVVAFDDPNTVYAATQNGYLVKSADGGQNWSGPLEPEYGQWTAPIVMDPQNSNELYYGGVRDIYKSIDGGNNWIDISNGTNNGVPYNRIAVAPSNNKYIYISQINDDFLGPVALNYSHDGGNTWTKAYRGLAIGNQYVSGIAVDKSSPDTVYMSLSGYNDKVKVLKSTDGGLIWTNISANLPNVPADCIASEGSTVHGVYVGTDLGVFYLCDTSTNGQWAYYNNGLPNVIVDDINIIPLQNKIRVATYGRGVWECALAGALTSIETTNALKKEIRIFPNPSLDIFNVSLPEYHGISPAIVISDMYGRVIKRLSPKDVNNNGTSFDLSGFASGIYSVTFTYPGGTVIKKLDLIR